MTNGNSNSTCFNNIERQTIIVPWEKVFITLTALSGGAHLLVTRELAGPSTGYAPC
jgi:hypothetical protein